MKDLTVSTSSLTVNLIKWLAWIEGTAIALAVFIVASVGSFVDWRKEIQFIKSRKETNSKNIVSICLVCAHFLTLLGASTQKRPN